MIMLAAVTDRKRVVHTAMRTRYHVDTDKLTDPTSAVSAASVAAFTPRHRRARFAVTTQRRSFRSLLK